MVNSKTFQDMSIDFDKSKWIEEIIEKQRELILKYKDVEGFGDLVDNDGRLKSLQSLPSQTLLKQMTFRVICEIAEMEEAIGQGDEEHTGEEIADALHFATELLIFVGLDKQQDLSVRFQELFEASSFISPGHGMSSGRVYYAFCLSDNCLKTKPWKKSQVVSDEVEYLKRVGFAYQTLFSLFFVMGYTPQDIHSLYFRKHKTNVFRIESNY